MWASLLGRFFAFSPDSRRLAVRLLDTSVVIWDVSSGKEISRFLSKATTMQQLLFGPDGTTLAVLSATQGFNLWDVQTGQELYRLPIPKLPFVCLAVLFEQDLLALGDFAGAIRFHRFSTG